MKIAWVILLISAFTDAVITAGTAITSAMVAAQTAAVPSTPVLILAAIGGVVAAARTVQQALKATPQTSADLSGAAVPAAVPKG